MKQPCPSIANEVEQARKLIIPEQQAENEESDRASTGSIEDIAEE